MKLAPAVDRDDESRPLFRVCDTALEMGVGLHRSFGLRVSGAVAPSALPVWLGSLSRCKFKILTVFLVFVKLKLWLRATFA